MIFNKLIPELSVSNYERSMAFYEQILGFKIEYTREENRFAMISYGSAQIMIEEINGHWETGKLDYPFGRGINFQIEVEDIEKLMDSLEINNYILFREPKENWYKVGKKLYGNKEFLVQDPDGYLLRFAQDIGIKEE